MSGIYSIIQRRHGPMTHSGNPQRRTTSNPVGWQRTNGNFRQSRPSQNVLHPPPGIMGSSNSNYRNNNNNTNSSSSTVTRNAYEPYTTGMMRKPNLVIIDFEGTLFDTRAAVAMTINTTWKCINATGLAPLGLEDKEIWQCMYSADTIEQGIQLVFTKARPGVYPGPFFFNIWVNVYKKLYHSPGMLAKIEPYPYAYELLKTLKAAKVHTVIFGSNEPQPFIWDVLKHSRMDHLIDRCMVMADTGLRRVYTKPNAVGYKQYELDLFSNTPGLSANDVLVVGDTEKDIVYAKRIGAKACWVSYGYGYPDRCRRMGPTIEIDSLAQLEKWIQAGTGNA
ncbi:HAD-like domain-containing protein [Cladorrhinum sp. PSN259]|nr:HAD-like domain-containing protein [Cladorrhinum sp. PSN259]